MAKQSSAHRKVSQDMGAATVREKKRQVALRREAERLFKASDDAMAVAMQAQSVADAKRVFRETLGHKIRRWLGF